MSRLTVWEAGTGRQILQTDDAAKIADALLVPNAAIVREGDAYLFHVLPPEEGTEAAVSLAWSIISTDMTNT